MLNRAAILPIISSQYTVWKESEFVSFWTLAKEWRDVTVYFVINKDAEIPSEFNVPNLVWVRVEDWFPYNVNASVVSSELYRLFNAIDGRYQVDVLFTSRTVVGANLARLFTVTPEIRVPVVLFENWVPRPKNTCNSSEVKLKSVSYSECSTIFLTNREKEFAKELARKYLTASCVQEIHEKGVVESCGANARRIYELASKTRKYDKFTLYFAGRTNVNKRWKEVLQVYEDVAKIYGDVQIKVVALGENIGDDVRRQFSKVEFLDPLPYWEYVDLLCKSHLSLSMSIDEGFSTGWTEQVCTGNPVLFPNKDWVWELVGKNYPFIYKDRDVLYAMIKWIKQNYDEARRKVQSFALAAVEKYDIASAAKRYHEILESQIEGTYVKFDDWVPKFLRVVDELPEEFSFEQFIKKAEEMYKASFGTYVILIGAYRNIYMVLKEHTDLVLGKPNHFRRRK